MHTDHADKVHAPHGDGSEASRSCTKQHVISPSSRGRPATEKGESGVRTEDGDNDGSDKCAGDWADGYSMNSVVPDELLGVWASQRDLHGSVPFHMSCGGNMVISRANRMRKSQDERAIGSEDIQDDEADTSTRVIALSTA